MDSYNNEVFSKRVKAGRKRTYFFDVKPTRGEDYFLTITESRRRMDGSFQRHKIMLYKEDINKFLDALDETVTYIKEELMPEYDYDEYNRNDDYSNTDNEVNGNLLDEFKD